MWAKDVLDFSVTFRFGFSSLKPSTDMACDPFQGQHKYFIRMLSILTAWQLRKVSFLVHIHKTRRFICVQRIHSSTSAPVVHCQSNYINFRQKYPPSFVRAPIHSNQQRKHDNNLASNISESRHEEAVARRIPIADCFAVLFKCGKVHKTYYYNTIRA